MGFVFAKCEPRPLTVSLPVFFLQNPANLQLGTEEDDQSFEEVKRTHRIPVWYVCTTPINCLFTRFVLQNPTHPLLSTEEDDLFLKGVSIIYETVFDVCVLR